MVVSITDFVSITGTASEATKLPSDFEIDSLAVSSTNSAIFSTSFSPTSSTLTSAVAVPSRRFLRFSSRLSSRSEI